MSGYFGEFMRELEEKAEQAVPVNDDDYTGEDGLIHCGRCGTPKQARINFLGEVRTPRCLCRCETEKRDAALALERQHMVDEHIRKNRKEAFRLDEMSHWNFAADDGENAKVTEAMRRYVENFPNMVKNGKGLLLWGSVGTGKTFHACEVANALIDAGFRVMVTNFPRISNCIQSTFEKRQEYIDSMSDYSLLVIDDLGAERASDYMRELVYNVIDTRYRSGLPLIITTNMSIDELKKPQEVSLSRIYDRVLERCFPIHVDGANRRRKKIRDEYNEMKELLGV